MPAKDVLVRRGDLVSEVDDYCVLVRFLTFPPTTADPTPCTSGFAKKVHNMALLGQPCRQECITVRGARFHGSRRRVTAQPPSAGSVDASGPASPGPPVGNCGAPPGGPSVPTPRLSRAGSRSGEVTPASWVVIRCRLLPSAFITQIWLRGRQQLVPLRHFGDNDATTRTLEFTANDGDSDSNAAVEGDRSHHAVAAGPPCT